MFTLPSDVAFVSCAIDIQKRYVQRLMVGWSPSGEAWLLESDQCEGDFTIDPTVLRVALQEVESVRFPHPDGGTDLRVDLCGVDVGYQATKVHPIVREAAALRPAPRWVYPTKGRGGISGSPLVQMREERDMHRRRGQRYLEINTDDVKRELVETLAVETPGPRYWHIPRRIGTKEFLEQLTGEERVTKFDADDIPVGHAWKKRRERNEALDLACISIALFSFLRPLDWQALLRRRYGLEDGNRRLHAMRGVA